MDAPWDGVAVKGVGSQGSQRDTPECLLWDVGVRGSAFESWEKEGMVGREEA